MMSRIVKVFLSVLIFGFLSQAAMAFPSWMGVYGDIQRHEDGNPGTFRILMNQDYYGLHAEVGLQVNDGEWFTVPMNYIGNKDGNSLWEVTPDFAFVGGSDIHFYFHGWDDWGGQTWDSDFGNNYSFTAPAVMQVGDNSWLRTVGSGGHCGFANAYVSVDVAVLDMSGEKQVGIVWTIDGWQSAHVTVGDLILDPGDGSLQYQVLVDPVGTVSDCPGFERELDFEYAVFYAVDGQTFWDNNNNQNYYILIK